MDEEWREDRKAAKQRRTLHTEAWRLMVVLYLQEEGARLEQAGPASLRWHRSQKMGCQDSRQSDPSDLGRVKHHMVESSPLVGCSACGAYGETAPRLLTQPCRGDPRGKAELKGMAAQLRALRKGRRPETKAKLGAPVTLHKFNSTGTSETDHPPAASREHPGTPTIDRDGTEFSEALRRRGRKQVEERPADTILARVRTKVAGQLLQASSNKRKIQEVLTPDEQNDPDLVDIWSEPCTSETPRMPDKEASNDAGEPDSNQQAKARRRVTLMHCETPAGGASGTVKPSRLVRLRGPLPRSCPSLLTQSGTDIVTSDPAAVGPLSPQRRQPRGEADRCDSS